MFYVRNNSCATVNKRYRGPLMLEPMTERLLRCENVEAAVSTILHDVVALHGAPFGNIQLHSPKDGTLHLVAQTGLPRSFVDTFRRVKSDDGTVCARALRNKKTEVVEDLEADEEFKPHLETARSANVRSVQSAPIIGKSGQLVGVVSTHFSRPFKPTPIESGVLHAYSEIAGDHLARLLAFKDVQAIAKRLQSALLA